MPTETVAPAVPAGVRWSRVLLPVFGGLSVMALVAALFVTPPWKRATKPPIDRPATSEETGVRFPLPDFTFTERGGKPFGKRDLDGKVWVASFVFTRCTGPCPSVSATMTRLQTELDVAAEPDLRLVTFTVDPGRDGVNELAKYADKFRADPAKWLFLTGPEADLHALLNKSFKVQAGPTTNPHPAEGQEFDHSTRLTVVDRAGNVRGYFDGYRGPNDPDDAAYLDSLRRLRELVGTLLTEEKKI